MTNRLAYILLAPSHDRRFFGLRLGRSHGRETRERAFRLATTTNDGVSGRHRNVDVGGEAIGSVPIHWKPAAWIEQVDRVVADVRDFQALDRTVIYRIKVAFVVEDQRTRGIFSDWIRQRDADGVVLAETLHGKRIARRIFHRDHPQAIVKIEDDGRNIVERRKLDLSHGANVMFFGSDVSVDDVAIYAQSGTFNGEQSRSTNEDKNRCECTAQGSACKVHMRNSPGLQL